MAVEKGRLDRLQPHSSFLLQVAHNPSGCKLTALATDLCWIRLRLYLLSAEHRNIEANKQQVFYARLF